MKRKFLCLLLALTMVLGLVATVSADPFELLTSGDWTYRIVRDTAVLVTYIGSETEVTVPATIEGYPVEELGVGLGGTAFEAVADTMTSVTIEDGITHINAGAFRDCTALKQVTIPDSVVLIGTFAFSGCTSLTEIELNEGLHQLHDYAFLNTGLTSIYIPASVTTISDHALGCTGEPGDVEFDESFTIYGYTGTAAEEYARYWHFNFVDLGGGYDNSGLCGNGTVWEYTAATGTLYIYGFFNDSAHYMDDYDEDEIPWLVHKPCITNVVIENVMDICYYAFQDCTNLTTVTMDDTVLDIHGAAFRNTPKLTNVKLSANLDFIGSHAFCDSGLTSITLPNSLTGIGPDAFSYSGLTSIDIPDSVTAISTGAFRSCTKLTDVKLPAGLDALNNQTFKDCTSLTEIELPETIQYIGWEDFSGSGLTSIEIPVSTTYIEENAFANCAKLNTVTFLGDAPEFRSDAFLGTTTTCLYPYGNTTWTEDVMQSYGGNVRWCAYDPELFRDVAIDEFYYDSVVWAVENGITSGVDAYHFAPNDSCLRSQVVSFLWRAAGRPVVEADNPFVDVKPTDYYYNAVLWAVKEGIVFGVDDNHFAPNETCNRSQVVTFLWRAAGKPTVQGTNPFKDVKSTDYYYNAILWAAKNKVTSGISADTFAPFDICNRSQVVTFLYRADKLPKPEPTPDTYTFELRSSDPTEETGIVFCEGTEFAAGESVIFSVDPWYGYLVRFEVNAEDVELYYLGGNYYELIMPDQDVVMTAHFVPATGDYHYISMACSNSFAVVDCLIDQNENDIVKPGEYVQIFIFPDEGCTFSENSFSASANGKPMKDWWYLGGLEDDPEYGTIHIVEMLMPNADVSISINCPLARGAAAAAAEVRVPVSVN